ncbi:hypothetical protein C9I56_21110 [Paraburkholderia caribensis]|uniref:Uncharacterized protein n=1 Tax=Paraburkholderia caribensis TaxID=75105 RepID=A0A9Q6S6T5_9BURK|nr:hypothetical protein C9I56_21110 [Paraburkholderia caribensis]QLB65219.1 hypothetical protein A9O66_22780 [Paraburkholderia caribensis]
MRGVALPAIMNGVGGLAVIVVLAGFAQLLAKVRGFGSTSDGYPASRKTSPLIGACWLRDCRLECRGCFSSLYRGILARQVMQLSCRPFTERVLPKSLTHLDE